MWASDVFRKACDSRTPYFAWFPHLAGKLRHLQKQSTIAYPVSLLRHYVFPYSAMSVSIARKIAFDVLLRVTAQDAYADEALRGALVQNVSTEDAGLATELTFGVLRWQRLLDFEIDRHITKANKSLDAEVRIALRLGVYQLLFLE